jgi:transposase
MQLAPTVFSQVTAALYPSEFSRCLDQFPNPRPPRGLTEYDQFLALCFGQLSYRESLRDIVVCLKARESLLYHLGFRGRVSRTNLAYANEHRDWRLFEALAQVLMRRAARLYRDEPTDRTCPGRVRPGCLDHLVEFKFILLGLLCPLQAGRREIAFDAVFAGQSAGLGRDHRRQLPRPEGAGSDPRGPGAYYLLDRGYLDFVRLFHLHQANGFFVVRNKHHVKFRVLVSRPVDKAAGLRCDQTIALTSNWSAKSYPQPLRRVRVYDSENQVTLVLLTNQFDLPAWVIAELYRNRWQVELFFKWIKQHLRIRSFYGRSCNAVRCQIWSAICAYLMVAIVRKQLKIQKSLNEILQILSVSLFEQAPLIELLATPSNPQLEKLNPAQNQKMFPLNY